MVSKLVVTILDVSIGASLRTVVRHFRLLFALSCHMAIEVLVSDSLVALQALHLVVIKLANGELSNLFTGFEVFMAVRTVFRLGLVHLALDAVGTEQFVAFLALQRLTDQVVADEALEVVVIGRSQLCFAVYFLH